ncbi:MAG: DUF3179 domain-containing (seleno)protein [Phycisphaerae bacterium]|nr:DUF3179 domain-containing (seleno)protein [Phycisphaerae bacterium]
MNAPAPRTRLRLRDAGWILIVTALAIAGLLVWAFAGVLAGHRPKGGGDLASYGFDLSTCLVDRNELVPTGQPRDFLRPLVVTKTMPVSEMGEFNRTHRKRYVVSDDRVIGVASNGESRAYPLLIVEAHEAIEDTLGGVPIVVTYSPLSDAAVVYERTVAGKELTLKLSGLVRNASTVFYDKTDETLEQASLWQQLDGRAIAGPAAARGERLEALPNVCITTFDDWVATHPDSTVIVRDEGKVRFYERISYRRAHESAQIEFPVSPTPPTDGLGAKEPVVVIEINGKLKAFAIERARAAGTVNWSIADAGSAFSVHLPKVRGAARVTRRDGEPVASAPMFWFAAYSTFGLRDGDVVRP